MSTPGWLPNYKEKKFIELIMNMSTATLMGIGPDTKETYIANLKLISKALREEKTNEPR